MATFLILHGPNLNLLGTREPNLYGAKTLKQINTELTLQANKSNHGILHIQSNAEHELIEHIHNAPRNNINFIIFNPAAFSHTSIALRDAILGIKIPFIEVHLTNIHQRESFRQHSYFSDIAIGVISGLGATGYSAALTYAIEQLSKCDKTL